MGQDVIPVVALYTMHEATVVVDTGVEPHWANVGLEQASQRRKKSSVTITDVSPASCREAIHAWIGLHLAPSAGSSLHLGTTTGRPAGSRRWAESRSTSVYSHWCSQFSYLPFTAK